MLSNNVKYVMKDKGWIIMNTNHNHPYFKYETIHTVVENQTPCRVQLQTAAWLDCLPVNDHYDIFNVFV